MNTHLEKLPRVSGDGFIAEGFRLSFEAINKLQDAIRSLEPRQSRNIRLVRTSDGFTIEPIAEPTESTTTTSGPARYA